MRLLAALAALARASCFLLAADMSFVGTEDCNGACSRFRTSPTSPPEDAFAILARSGLNTVRVRLWNGPVGDETYANLTGVLSLAERIHAAGLGLWLDFHYSDTWADPGHQSKPVAWSTLAGAQLEAAVYNFTRDALAALGAQGTPPVVVQVGNEVSDGMLWAPNGQPCSSGGYISSPCAGNFNVFAALVAAGIRAVRDTLPAAMVMIHSAQGSNVHKSGGVQAIIDFYSNLIANGAGDFDCMGLSFYPHFGGGNSTNIALLSQVVAALPGKSIIIAETAYPYEDSSDPNPQFPYTPTGQLQYLQSVLAQVHALPRGVGAGVSWWGTEYVNGSGAGMTALWDTNYVALPALLQGWKQA